MLLIPTEHSMSAVTFGIKTLTPSGTKRSTRFASSRWTKREPGAPLQYRSLISEVTSNPLPRAWIELLRVVIKASEAKQEDLLGFESMFICKKKHSWLMMMMTCSSFQFQKNNQELIKIETLCFVQWKGNFSFLFLVVQIVFSSFLAVFECCCLVSQRLDFGLCELVGCLFVCSFECNEMMAHKTRLLWWFSSWPVIHFLSSTLLL